MTNDRSSSRETQLASEAIPGPTGEFARLVFHTSHQETLHKDILRNTTLIGSAPGCNIQLVLQGISPAHCVITLESGWLRIRDLRSRTGTKVNGTPVEVQTLFDGDTVDVGPISFRMETNLPPDGGLRGAATAVGSSADEQSAATAEAGASFQAERERLLRQEEELSQAAADIEREGYELAQLREQLESEQTEFHVRREQLQADLDELAQRREEFHTEQAQSEDVAALLERGLDELKMQQEQFQTEQAALQSRRQQQLSQLEELQTQERHHAEAIAQFEADRCRSQQVQARASEAAAELQRGIQELQHQREQLQAQQMSLHADRQRLELEREEFHEEQQQFRQEAAAAEAGGDDLRRKTERSSTKVAELERDLAELQQQRNELRNQQATFFADQQQLQTKQDQLQAERQQIAREHEAQQAARRQLEQNKQEAAAKADTLQRGLEGLAEDGHQLQSHRDKFQAENGALQIALEGLRKEQQRFDEEVILFQADRNRLEEEQQQSSQAAAELERRLQDLAAQREQLRGEQAALQTQREQFQHDLEVGSSEQQRFREEVARFETDQHRLEQQKQEAANRATEVANRATELEHGLAELQMQSEKIRVEQTELQAAQQQLQTDRDQLEAQQQRISDMMAANNECHAQLAKQTEQHAEVASELERERRELEIQRVKAQTEQADLRADRQQLETAVNQLREQQQPFHQVNTEEKSKGNGAEQANLPSAGSTAVSAASNSPDVIRLVGRHQVDWLLESRFLGFFIDGYHVIELYGSGGMGWVYEAKNDEFGQRVALKVLYDEHVNDAGMLARFELEACAGLQLDHPHIVRTFEHHRSGDMHYIVMELVDGINLKELIDLQGRVSWPQACDFISQAAAGLQHMHQRGLVHRDMKPTNLLIEHNGELKIIDFGLTMIVQDQDELSLLTDFGHNCVGSADFIAPEQTLNSFAVDARADVYSLGCAFYFALSGGVPFPVPTISEKLEAHRMKKPRPLRQRASDVPEEVAAIVEKMVHKEPDHRYQSAAAVVEALQPFAQRQQAHFDFQAVLAARAAEARQRLLRVVNAANNGRDLF